MSGTSCVKKCETGEYIDAFTDPNHPRCTIECPDDYYIDTVNNICVPSCKNLEITSYIYLDAKLSKKVCIPFACPSDYVIDETTDLDRPTCVTECP